MKMSLPVLYLMVGVGSLAVAAPPVTFSKVNREQVICSILQEVARATGGTTAMSDSGSGKLPCDMDVTCKLILKRADGSSERDLTPAFIAAARTLYGDKSDFDIDEHGGIRSRKLDTAVHDAQDAVPDFRCALPPEPFKVRLMDSMSGKETNPDAYFTAGGNSKQVNQRMQSNSRLRVFHPDGKMQETTIDRNGDPDGYSQAMKTYFDINPEELPHRMHGRDLFGDSFDSYRQAQMQGHVDDPQNIRGNPKHNTRMINNFLESHGYPNWNGLTAERKNEALGILFPDAAHAAGRDKLMRVLDDSFTIYSLRDMAGGSMVGDQSDFNAFSEMFQRAAIADMARQRLPDLLNPNITLQDVKDHAQAQAQADGKEWNQLSLRERLEHLQAARDKRPELIEKLKFAAAGELAMVFKSLEGMDSERSAHLREQIMAQVPENQRVYVQNQLDLVSAYTRDESNRKANGDSALRHQREVLGNIQDQNLLDADTLGLARKMRKQMGAGMRHIIAAADGTIQGYHHLQEMWATVKANLDPTSEELAGTLDKLDKLQSVLNLIKVYQDSGGDPEAMKRALYMEVSSRYVPGYDSYQLYKLWASGDPQAQEEVEKQLVFQGLTLLPGGAIAKAMKLSVDVARTGLDITIGYTIDQGVQENVNLCLGGGSFDSILSENAWNIPGSSITEQRRNLYQAWKGKLDLKHAFRRMNAERRLWNSLRPYQKANPAQQARYRLRVQTFHELVRQRIASRVNGYLSTTGMLHNESRLHEALVNTLYADFVNGMNRELGESLLRDAQQQAKEAETVLDTVDDYLFGLFSKALDTGFEMLASDVPELPPGRFSLAFDASERSKDPVTGEDIVSCAVQVIPPLRPVYEDRNTTYVLEIPEDDELQAQIVNGRVKFRLRHPRTRLVVAEKEFCIDQSPPPLPVIPNDVSMTFQDVQKFLVTTPPKARDSVALKWDVSGGTMISNDVFKAGDKEGVFPLTVMIDAPAAEKPEKPSAWVRIFRPVSDAEMMSAAVAFVKGPGWTSPPPGVKINQVEAGTVNRRVNGPGWPRPDIKSREMATGVVNVPGPCPWMASVTIVRKGTFQPPSENGEDPPEPQPWSDFKDIWTGLKKPGGPVETILIVPASSMNEAY